MIRNTKIYKYYNQVKQETQRVVWPTSKSLISSTIVVLVAIVITSIICLFVDYGIHAIINFFLKLGK